MMDRMAWHGTHVLVSLDATHQPTPPFVANGCSLATEEGVLVACGGRGEATVYDTRTFSVRNVLQGA